MNITNKSGTHRLEISGRAVIGRLWVNNSWIVNQIKDLPMDEQTARGFMELYRVDNQAASDMFLERLVKA